MRVDHFEDGHKIARFMDANDNLCAVEETILACVWVGVEKPYYARVLLTPAIARDLIVLLTSFVDTGELPEESEYNADTVNPQTEVVPGERFIPGVDTLPMPATLPEQRPTKRGVNLGCGMVCLPCERPLHHQGVPEELYTDTTIRWDNVDRNQEQGVTNVVDLFTYPWNLPSNTYDLAIAAHIVEHIPHHIIWNGADWGDYSLKNFSTGARELISQFGQVIPHHPVYQDGWFAWFSELYRIMKPGGKVYIPVPYAWSHSGISDPTHTRYMTLETFGYFSNITDEKPTFRYRMDQYWDVKFNTTIWAPHYQAYAIAKAELEAEKVRMSREYTHDDVMQRLYNASHSTINAFVDFTIMMEAVKDET